MPSTVALETSHTTLIGEIIGGNNFAGPDQSSSAGFNARIETAAGVLKAEPPPIAGLPQFLKSPLDQRQKQAVEEIIGAPYAQAGVKLQDSLRPVLIRESDELLVSLEKLFARFNLPASFSQKPFHEASLNGWAGQPRLFWVREQVGEKLVNAARAFQAIGVIMHFEDGYRPPGVQEGLFWRRIGLIKQVHPAWFTNSDAFISHAGEIWNEARSKTAIAPWLAGHKAGASVDITLFDQDTSQPLEIGAGYPSSGAEVALAYPYLTQEQWQNRRLFCAVMTMSGLAVYPYENWHASAGDVIAAASHPTGETIYGPIDGFDPQTGRVRPTSAENYYRDFFTKEQIIKGWVKQL